MRSAVWGEIDFPVTQPYNPPVHMGIDIGCPSGTAIYAARRGYVERVQQGMVSVQVGPDYAHLGTQRDFYLHGNPAAGIVVGVFVDAGQHIIDSDTVQVDPRFPLTGPHLHFEVQDGHNLPGIPIAPGAPLDPVPVLLIPPVPLPPPPPPPVVLNNPITTYSVVGGDGFRLEHIANFADAKAAADAHALAFLVITNVNDESTGNSVYQAEPPSSPGAPPPPVVSGGAPVDQARAAYSGLADFLTRGLPDAIRELARLLGISQHTP